MANILCDKYIFSPVFTLLKILYTVITN